MLLPPKELYLWSPQAVSLVLNRWAKVPLAGRLGNRSELREPAASSSLSVSSRVCGAQAAPRRGSRPLPFPAFGVLLSSFGTRGPALFQSLQLGVGELSGNPESLCPGGLLLSGLRGAHRCPMLARPHRGIRPPGTVTRLSFGFLRVCIFESERETQAPHCAGRPTRGSLPAPWDRDLSCRWTLDPPSHPGAPHRSCPPAGHVPCTWKGEWAEARLMNQHCCWALGT